MGTLTTLTQEQVNILLGNGLPIPETNKLGFNYNPEKLRFFLRNTSSITLKAGTAISAPLVFDIPDWTYDATTLAQSPTVFGCTWANANSWSQDLGAMDTIIGKILFENECPVRIAGDAEGVEVFDFTNNVWDERGIVYKNGGVALVNRACGACLGGFYCKDKIEPNAVGEIVFYQQPRLDFVSPIYNKTSWADTDYPLHFYADSYSVSFKDVSLGGWGVDLFNESIAGRASKLIVIQIPPPYRDGVGAVAYVKDYERKLLTYNDGGIQKRAFYDPLTGPIYTNAGTVPDNKSSGLIFAVPCFTVPTNVETSPYFGLCENTAPPQDGASYLEIKYQTGIKGVFRVCFTDPSDYTSTGSGAYNGTYWGKVGVAKGGGVLSQYVEPSFIPNGVYFTPKCPSFHQDEADVTETAWTAGTKCDANHEPISDQSSNVWDYITILDGINTTVSGNRIHLEAFISKVDYDIITSTGGGGGTAESHTLSPSISGTYYSGASVSTDGSVLTLTKSSFPSGITRNWVVQ